MLILNSYHPGYAWTDEELAGLRARLAEEYPDLPPSIEYLDTKRFPSEDRLVLVKDYLAAKYRDREFDLVIVLDNSALSMALNYREELFPGVPIVFAGINDFKPEMLSGHKDVTGVAEKVNIAGTLETALALHPHCRQIIVVNDYTSTGLALRRVMDSILPRFRERVDFTFLPSVTIEEMLEHLRSAPSDALVLILSFVTDREDRIFPAKGTSLICSATTAPVYAIHKAYLGYGIVGGILLSGEGHGRKAGDIASRILSGEDPAGIPVVVESTASPMFDYMQLARFNVALSALPQGSTVINRPWSFYEHNKAVVWSGLSVLTVLSMVIVMLLWAIVQRRQAYKLARRSEARLSAIVNNAQDCIFIKGTSLRYTLVNPAMCNLLGMRQKEILGKTDMELFDADSAMELYCFDEGVLDGAVADTLLAVTIRGEKRYFHTIKVPLLDAEGQITGLCGIARDITERKLTEQALVENEEKYRKLLEDASDAIFHADVETGMLLDGNQKATALTGWSTDELKRMHQRELHPPEKCGIYSAAFREHLASPGKRIEAVVLHRDGRHIPVEVSASTFTMNGRLVIQGIFRDVTERKRAEEALQESEQHFRTLADSGQAMIWTSGEDMLCNYFNRPWLNFTGRSIEQELGEGWAEGVHPEDLADCIKTYSGAFDRRENFSMVYRLRRNDGEYRWIVDDGTPRYDRHGTFLGYIGHCLDITDQRREVEERQSLQAQLFQAQKIEAIGRLAGGVAHDFNNMLGVIIGRAELAMAQIGTSHASFANLTEIRKAAERSTDLTRQLLAFARRQTISPKVLDLNETVEGMLRMLRRLIGENIDLAWLPAENLCPVKMDASQIDQILANLAVNARDATEDVGTMTIETANVVFDQTYCLTHEEVTPGEYVLLGVSDTGSGMDKRTLESIFEPFFTTKEVGKGTGLGLATIYGIVKQNNGFINVYSEPGHGTTFKIYIPRAEEQVTEGFSMPLRRDLRGKETVLLVEDEGSILSLGKTILQRHGYEILATKSPTEAVEIAKNHPQPIHLLITDVVMPEMNGKDLKDKVSELKPDLKSIFMSGYTANVIAHHGVLDEDIDFLQKPFSVQALLEKVRDVLDG
ncbi:MAG: PAS domain S-box protein [Syntrophobacteraceae bacterium]